MFLSKSFIHCKVPVLNSTADRQGYFYEPDIFSQQLVGARKQTISRISVGHMYSIWTHQWLQINANVVGVYNS